MNISVIITSYNYKRFVKTAVDSVLNQTMKATQILVVDDGSTDGTVAFLEENYAGIEQIHIIAKPNGGQLSAFRAGMRAANGEIIAFLDADDYWDESYLETVVEVFSKNPSVDFVFCNLRFCDGKTGQWPGPMKHATTDVDLGISSCLIAMSQHRPWLGNPTSSISTRSRHLRAILQIPEGYDAEWRLQADDVLVHGSSIVGGHKYYIADIHVNYRVHGENGWFQKDPTKTTPIALCKTHSRTERLVSYFSHAAFGNQTPTCQAVFYEFKSKYQVSLSSLRTYLTLLWAARGTTLQRLIFMALMINHWRRRNVMQT